MKNIYPKFEIMVQDGAVKDQVAAINVHGKYFCPLSLRMQKSIWRHIRLRKGFVNLEQLSQVKTPTKKQQCVTWQGLWLRFIYAAQHVFCQGGYKLKIPTMLLSEKERTRSRFTKPISDHVQDSLHNNESESDTDDVDNKLKIRMNNESDVHVKKNRKRQKKNAGASEKHVLENNKKRTIALSEEEADIDMDLQQDMDLSGMDARNTNMQSSNTLASIPVLAQKIRCSLHEDILSLTESMQKNLLPPFTPFSMSEDDTMQHLVHVMQRECPNLCTDVSQREKLVFAVLSMLEKPGV